jgi:AbrB family looped-hinge helix DNA binding protein
MTRRIGGANRVGPKGQVVIPKELRDELGIEPGDHMVFWRDGDHVAARPVGRGRPLQGRFSAARESLAEQLLRERRADRAREDER